MGRREGCGLEEGRGWEKVGDGGVGKRGERGMGIVSPINIAGGHGTQPWVRDGGVS